MKALIELIKCVVLGLVQGLGEFLPISSSGHLLLVQRIFGITEGGQLFTVLLHVATLAAVCIVYRKQLLELIRHPIQWKTLWLIVATVVTAAVMLVFKKYFDAAEDGRFLGWCFILTALLLTAAEIAKRRVKGIAVFPGVSRSGATITGALMCGVRRDEAAEFSFLLSIPAILGGAVLEVPDLIKNGTGDFSWYGLIVGMIVAGVSGYFAIRFMLRLITKKRFTGFIIYTAALGVFLILNQYVLHLF